MPAVTVSDLTTLPAIPALRTGRSPMSVRSGPSPPRPRGLEGEGFPVRRAFAGVTLQDLDPFVHMDQMGEVEYAPGEPKGTPWHPHRGFETVTYMIDGTFQHQDSHGGGGVITDGATQWMTAGKGILHIETPPEKLVVSGGLFHGIQLWVNLPARDKMIEPAYQGLEADDVTLLSSTDGGALVRIIAGDVAGHRGPGIHAYAHGLHARVDRSRGPARAPLGPRLQRARLSPGRLRTGGERRPTRHERAARHVRRRRLPVAAGRRRADPEGPTTSRRCILGGQPIREPVEHYGPFVMNTKAEIGQALEDFEAGRLGTIPPNALMPHVPDPAPVRTERSGI